jgi:nitroreductase
MIAWTMPDALELLTTRRSFKAVELAGPPPSAAEIDTLLTVASRVPDHGKLAPWRFIVFEGEARRSAGEAIAAAFRAKYPDAKPEHIEAERERLVRAPLVIAVVSRAGPHVKIPEWEQVLSAGAAAMSLVLAAHALGYGANWITEWYAAACWMPSAWHSMSASPALFTLAGRRVHPRIGRGRRSMRSQSALPA